MIEITQIDADAQFAELIGETPRTLTYVDNRIRTEGLDAGITKRLLAALTSAGERGGVDWDVVPVDETQEHPHRIAGDTISRMVQLTAYSTGGTWSQRAWWMRATLSVARDPWGVVEYTPVSGETVVSGSDGTLSRFAGQAVANLVVDVWRTRGAASNCALNLLDCPEPERLDLDGFLARLEEVRAERADLDAARAEIAARDAAARA